MPSEFPRRQPKPRPRGESFNQPFRPADRRPMERRPAPRPAARRSRGPAVAPPAEPASGKQRRRMLKAAAWRLARLVHAKPATLMSAEETKLQELLERAFPPPTPKAPRIAGRGNAERLAAKLLRLQKHDRQP